MSHFAKLDKNNVVVFVTVGRQEDDGLEAELSERTGDVYRQTSYNTHGGVHSARWHATKKKLCRYRVHL